MANAVRRMAVVVSTTAPDELSNYHDKHDDVINPDTFQH